jgi:apolipoprotein N-acyltransferase
MIDWRGRLSSPLAISLTAGLLMWASFPPLNWWPLAYLATAVWAGLVRVEHLSGRRPYLAIWVGALVFWLLLLQGIRLPHLALYAGWFALSAYLAVYVPLAIGLARVAVRRLRWPMIVAAPVVWTAGELIRGRFLGGCTSGMVGHTQIEFLELIQIADFAGAYGVSFLVVLVGACLAQVLPMNGQRYNPWPIAVAVAALAGACVYGGVALQQIAASLDPSRPSVEIALVQGDTDVIFTSDIERNVRAYRECRALAADARAENPNVRLIIWPESMFVADRRELILEGELRTPPGIEISAAEFRQKFEQFSEDFRQKRELTAYVVNGGSQDPTTYQLVGSETEIWGAATPRLYNTAMLIDGHGEVQGRYFKMHRVMFGEYIPIVDWFPILYHWTPMPQGLTSGREPQQFVIDGVRFSPSICFESTVPQLIHRHFSTLQASDSAPDVLVNLTNDGWFHGSTILDLHFANNVFRAIEFRRPFLVAANTGVTAWIDSAGRVRNKAPRRTLGFVMAKVSTSDRTSGYQRWGDLFAMLCAIGMLAPLCLVIKDRVTRREASEASDKPNALDS